MGVITAALFGIMAIAGVWAPRLGLDLRGGTTITLTASNATGGGSVDATKLEEARRIIQQRVDGMGVGEAVVTTQGDQHIIVSVPNIQRDELVNLVGTTASLTFRAVYAETPVTPVPSASPDPSGSASPGASPTPSALPGFPQQAPSPRPSPSGSGTAEPTAQLDIAQALAWQPSAEDQAAFQAYTCGSETHDVLDAGLITCTEKGDAKYLLGPVLITGTHVTGATAGQPQNQVAYVVNLSFDSAGAESFYQATNALYSKTPPQNQFAIVLDSKVVSAPAPRGPIAGGNAEISGSFTLDSATQLANILRYGALPLSFQVSQVENVSATLGGEQLTGGIIAGIIGLALVILYSFIYYRALGLVVVGSLAAAAALTYSIMVLLGESVGFALNLPGIAGVIVAIGMTADSFIIYFERIRDEIREGRSLRTAIETGWKRARGTIVIADMVSMLSAFVLFFLAVGGVKGFAFTLGLTTLIDLAVVFWFTHPLMTLLGRTTYFGEGRPGSGLSPDHMGVSRASLLGRRTRPATRKGATA